jgi:hypothetical protein
MLLFTSLFGGGGFGMGTPQFTLIEDLNLSGSSSLRAFESGLILAQRYTITEPGKVVALRAYFGATGTPDFRMSLYTNNGSLPDALLAFVESAAPGAAGWAEFALDPGDYVDVVVDDVVWVAAQSSANINSASSITTVNSGRRLRSLSFASGPPDPFASTGNYSNTRGMGLKIWTNR